MRSRNDVLEPVKDIDAVELAGRKEGVKHRGTPRTVVRAGKEIALSSDCDRSNLALNRIVVEFEESRIKDTLYGFPLDQRILNRFHQRRLRERDDR